MTLVSEAVVDIQCSVLYEPNIYYSGTSPIGTPIGQKKVSLLVRCLHFRGRNACKSGSWGGVKSVLFREVSSFPGCPYRELYHTKVYVTCERVLIHIVEVLSILGQIVYLY